MRKVTSVRHIRNPYLRRILSYVLHKDPLLVLSRTPRRLRRLTRGMTETQIWRRPANGRWSVGEILTHLSDIEVVLGFRFRMVLSQPGSPLQAMDQNKWAVGLKYRKADWKKKLKMFAIMRDDHLALLRSVTRGQWKRWGIHEERGRETLQFMVQTLAGHDVNHLMQIEQIRQKLRGNPGVQKR